jgi:enoyl-CoA hydratase
MTFKHLTYERSDAVVTITFVAEKGLNAFHSALLSELNLAVDRLSEEEGLRVVLFKGSGKAFIAGADISEMADLGAEEGRAFGEFGQEIFAKIEALAVPTIAVIDGFTLGGGNEMAMACDMRIASTRSKFGQPEVSLGITPGFGGSFRLPRLVGVGKAKELLFTGRMIDAEEALAIGLVNQAVDPEELDGAVEKIVKAILRNAPIAIAHTKRAVDAALGGTTAEGNAIEAAYFGLCFATEDQKTGMKAFLAKEKADFQGK